MEPTAGKPGSLGAIMVRVLVFAVLLIALRFAFVVIITGESCKTGDFCFFSLPNDLNFVIPGAGAGAGAGAGDGTSSIAVNNVFHATSDGHSGQDLYTSKDWIQAASFYSSNFQDLISKGYLKHSSKSLCLETPIGQEVFALKATGVSDSIGIFKKASKPLVVKGEANHIPFDNNTFDFVFLGGGRLDKSSRPLDIALEISRTLKPKGFAVFHVSAKDTYSFNSFVDLFNCFKIVTSQNIDGFDSSMPFVRQIVVQKTCKENHIYLGVQETDGNSEGKCTVPKYKHELVQKAEPLILEEPLKPWITFKRNVKKIKYLPSMVDISFKSRYVYVDVGARSYGSSIVSWFKKQYPKQNKTFDVYAIEADEAFHEEYGTKKGVTLLPYAAWVRNETLVFEINRDPGHDAETKGRGMGRIQPVVRSSGNFNGEVNEIQGFDFANWLKNTVTERDFVVMKMDVEGTEFDLIPRLIETGAICLINEIFLECHYNRWQRCCPGERSSKYEKTYGQCLDLFASLRKSGVLVHQWW